MTRRLLFLWIGLGCLAVAGFLIVQYQIKQQDEELKSIVENLTNKSGQFILSYIYFD